MRVSEGRSMRRVIPLSLILWTTMAPATFAEPVSFPQRIWTRYESRDPRAGGEVVLWVERERIWYGASVRNYPNAMLFQPARYVEITQITPTEGSPPITAIEIGTVNGSTPDYYQFTGFLRLRMS